MSNTLKERNRLKELYPGDGWKRRVDKMSDAQIIAVYRRLQANKKL